MILRNRQLLRLLQIGFLCIICFTLGTYYSNLNGANNCVIAKMDPSHTAYSDLKDGFSGALKSQSTFLVIVIISHPKNLERRNVIRQTWLNIKDRSIRKDVLPLFVVGNENLSELVTKNLEEETSSNKDVLVLPIQETYTSLTQKVLASLVQVERNVKFSFLLKVDDDSFVNLPVMVDELRNSNYNKGLYWGFFDGRAPVQRTGKWAEGDYVLCDRYIPYALGGGYVLSHDLVSYISTNSELLKLFNSEDVSVGTWLAPLKNIHRVHDVRFDTEFKSRGCNNKHIVSHKQSVEDLKSKQYMLTSSTNRICESESRVRNSYEYNWNVAPSSCCSRHDSSLP